MNGARARETMLVVFLFALSLRALPLRHGLPGLYVPDSHNVRAALGMAQTRNLVPRSNEYTSYPYLYSYACLPLFVADYAMGRATGRYASMDAYRAEGLKSLDRFHFFAREVSALAGAVAAAAAVIAAATLWGTRAGAFAGLLGATGPLTLLLSVQERPWAMALAFTSVAFAAAARALRGGASRWPLVVCAFAAGAAGGSHQVGAAALAIPVATAWWLPGARRGRGLAAVLGAFAFAFLAGNPYLVRYGLGGAVQTQLTEETGVSLGGQGLAMKFDARFTIEALTGLFALETFLPFTAIAGLAIALRARDRAAFVATVFALPVLALCVLYTGTHARYFSVVLPVAWVFGGCALDRLASLGRFGWAAAFALVLVPLAITIRIDQLLLRQDTRNEAAAWFEDRIPAGARVAAEPYGPPLRTSVEALRRVAAIDPMMLTRREQAALEREEPGGFDLLPLERVAANAAPDGYGELSRTGKKLYPSARDLLDVMREAGIEFVVRVDRFPARPRADPLARLVEERGELVFEAAPQAPGRAEPREALLPVEPRTGVLALASVDRPGPRVRIYRLPRL